jgi:hypothetical protein
MSERALWMRKELLIARPNLFEEDVTNALTSWQWKPEDSCQ